MSSLEKERDLLKAQSEISQLKVRKKLIWYLIQLKLREKDDDIVAKIK